MATAANQPIGEKLRIQRVEVLNKGLREMAGLLDIAPAHMTDIEKGRRTPSEGLMVKMAEQYHLPIADLRAGFSRPDAIVSEVASQNPTTAAKVPEFLRTARNLSSEQWDRLIQQAGKMAGDKRGETMKRKESTTFKQRFYPGPIEREAEACIARCMKALSLSEMPLPIPVEQWIEGPLKLSFGIEDLSHLGTNVLGAAYIQEREILVSEQLLSNERRLRFTCAHELGHFILHGKLLKAFRDTTAEPQQGRDLHEREADHFAAALLMPAEPAVQAILQVCGDRQCNPLRVREIVMTAQPGEQKVWLQILGEALVSRFTVSMAAAEYRVRELLQPVVGPFVSAVRPPLFLSGR